MSSSEAISRSGDPDPPPGPEALARLTTHPDRAKPPAPADRQGAEEPAATAPGQRIGRFTVLGKLGRGGMGSVLQAYDDTLGRRVAIKLMHKSLRGRHEKRMLREAQALARLSHPNVVQVYEVGKLGDRLFIAMELVGGQTLHHWQRKPRSWQECLEVYLQAGQGLAAAHAVGLVHRDFKPANCIMDEQGRVRVLDFGLARDVGALDDEDSQPGPRASASRATSRRPSPGPPAAIDRTSARGLPPDVAALIRSSSNSNVLEEDLTRTGALLGTLAYMPPEQVRGQPANAQSDQFSFCASLYEAICGARPFSQGGISAIAMAYDGELLQPPPGVRLPRWLLETLRRGLSVDEDKRWPSMNTLLVHMQRRRRPRWPRLVPLGVAGASTLALGLALWDRAPPPCQEIPAQLEGTWDEARRRDVEDKLLGSGLAYAGRTWEVVGPELDEYAARWTTLRTSLCHATHQSSELTAPQQRRQDCLDDHRVYLREAVNVLLEADVGVITQAPQVVGALPPLSRCENDQALKFEPRPADIRDTRAVSELRHALARVTALHSAGKYAQGLAALAPLKAQAQALGYGPLRSRMLKLRGDLHRDAGHYEQAERDLGEAYRLALEHGAHDLAIDAATGLIHLTGYKQAQSDTVEWLGATVLALTRWRDPGGARMATALTAIGLVRSAQGRHAEALEHHQQALALQRKAAGDDDLGLVSTLNNVAMTLQGTGDHPGAERHARDAIRIIESRLGERHPMLALHLTNLGALLDAQGKLASARALHERALEIHRAVALLSHPTVGHIRTNLGSTLLKQGAPSPAQEQCQAALTIWEDSLRGGTLHPWVSKALNCVGLALTQQARHAEAQTEYQRAVDILLRRRPDHPELPAPLINLATVEQKLGQLERAERHYREALGIIRRGGARDPNLVTALNKLGSLAFRDGRPHDAIRLHTDALGALEGIPDPDPGRLAVTLWALGRALGTTGQRERARAHLERALQVHERRGLAHIEHARSVWNTHQTLADMLVGQPTQADRARQRIEAVARRYEAAGETILQAEAQRWLDEHPAPR